MGKSDSALSMNLSTLLNKQKQSVGTEPHVKMGRLTKLTKMAKVVALPNGSPRKKDSSPRKKDVAC